ncbi:LPXTG cell wall anchor domain-containing protein [Pseudoclavibacter sp. VKM Ac-2867]|uniref:LPXTG cell wall anchor domain-containing protein n=1 Tax=Pseudoclavibacter sp. VKM Ac-2867 TaxID=2783829 RepID=UPI00188CD553|nr:LPXTG cell wall anchor domain-containing protein [Pseudoclavibacter sp. VKM Ac-2867]MBF4457335.1 LPXTG cell wall anchor domain-containing protein [Pseudoclavibacter sp. VKM Ac-2867]
MKKFSAGLALILAVVAGAGFSAPAAIASPLDQLPPELRSLSIEHVDSFGDGDKIVARWTVAEVSSIAHLHLTFKHPSGSTFWLGETEITSDVGGFVTGTTSAVVDSSKVRPGTYTLDVINLGDKAVNHTSLRQGDGRFVPLGFEVADSGIDFQGPENVQFSLRTPGPFAPDDRIIVDWAAEDEHRINVLRLIVTSPSGRSFWFYIESSELGEDGVQRGTASIAVDGEEWPSGAYSLTEFAIGDELGNLTTMKSGESGYPELRFEVGPTNLDVTDPVLISVVMTSPEVVRPGDSVSFDWTAFDDRGIRSVGFSYRSVRPAVPCEVLEPCHSHFLGDVTITSVVDGVHTGTTSSVVDDPFRWTSGRYELRSVSVIDTTGNQISIRAGDSLFPEGGFFVDKGPLPSPTPTGEETASPTAAPSPSSSASPQPTQSSGPDYSAPATAAPSEPSLPVLPTATVAPSEATESPSAFGAGSATNTPSSQQNPVLASTGRDASMATLAIASVSVIALGLGALLARRRQER